MKQEKCWVALVTGLPIEDLEAVNISGSIVRHERLLSDDSSSALDAQKPKALRSAAKALNLDSVLWVKVVSS
jgi:hypothetical protein